MSVQACNATNSAPRRDASSKAISVANSEVGEPSTPTSTGACADRGGSGSSSWMIATGQCAWWASPELTDPSRALATPPWPRQPTTTISACWDSSTMAGTIAA